uniref:Uncharacterized protein n=1 Tax=Trichuris muris TaxID=70415 RepID=A0A5S6QW90_TRIMR
MFKSIEYVPETDETRWRMAAEAVTALSGAFERYARDHDDGLYVTPAHESATTVRVALNAANYQMHKTFLGVFQHTWLPTEFNGWICGVLGKNVMIKRDDWRLAVSRNFFHLQPGFKAFFSASMIKRKATEEPPVVPAVVPKAEPAPRVHAVRTRARR